MMYVCGSGICGMESAMSGTRLFLVSYWYRPENICTARRRVGVALNRSGLSEATSLSSSMRKVGDVPVCAGAVVGLAAAGGVVGAGALVGAAAGAVVGFAAAGAAVCPVPSVRVDSAAGGVVAA